MYLCSACEKIPESVMSIVSEYNQIHWFCQYCDALVSQALSGQVSMNENLPEAVQNCVSQCVKEVPYTRKFSRH